MTETLAQPAKRALTREYVKTLPKRPAPAVVSPEEFTADLDRKRAKLFASAVPFEPSSRNDRVRPSARKVRQSTPPPRTTWACRPIGDRDVHRGAPGMGSKRKERVSDLDYVREILYDVQSGTCALCGTGMWGNPTAFSVDHFIPRALGGRNYLGNFVLSHSECNVRKANDAPTGCESVWLFLVNAKLGLFPDRW